ncbi:TPA: hypothetical protein DIC38_00890 [Candidatus Nomurabacteria bacterium]|nr:MAG: TraR/DksA family transcriptional regulator [Parcubacteria bacterium RAAC4_OD1_1]HCY26228.1 hypothetical protein [Candidatus Nomurabacteria bacterium]
MMDTNIYKKKLEEEKKVLLEELGGIGKVDKNGDWDAVPEGEMSSQEVQDEADMADKAEDYEKRSSILNSLEKRLADINNALKKIENSTYGACEVCGNEIEEDRLEVNPSAKTCKICIDKKD